jgi:cobalt-zinc-cadmium resistance protein CzcA
VGGGDLTQVPEGDQRYNIVPHCLPQDRGTGTAFEDIRLLAPSGERVSFAQLCPIHERDGEQRLVAIKQSVGGHDLGTAG